MTKLQAPPLSAEDLEESLLGLLSAESRKSFESRLDLDFGLELSGVARFRANCSCSGAGRAPCSG